MNKKRMLARKKAREIRQKHNDDGLVKIIIGRGMFGIEKVWAKKIEPDLFQIANITAHPFCQLDDIVKCGLVENGYPSVTSIEKRGGNEFTILMFGKLTRAKKKELSVFLTKKGTSSEGGIQNGITFCTTLVNTEYTEEIINDIFGEWVGANKQYYKSTGYGLGRIYGNPRDGFYIA